MSDGTREEENGLVLDEDESHELQEVFSTIFPQYLVPIEELIGQLLDGGAGPEIVVALRGAIAPLATATNSVGVTRLKALLDEFQEVVERVGDDEVSDATRNEIIDVFYRLKEVVQTLGGAAPAEPDRSDFVARLSKVNGVGADAVHRVLAAGISSPEQITGATLDEIGAVTGLDEELSRRIVTAFGGAPARERVIHDRDGDREDDDLLEAQVGLVGLVRERLRLTELVEHEREAVARVTEQRDAVRDGLTARRHRLRMAREALAREEAEFKRCRRQLASTRAELETANEAAARGGDLEDLHQRLRDLRRRIARRFH